MVLVMIMEKVDNWKSQKVDQLHLQAECLVAEEKHISRKWGVDRAGRSIEGSGAAGEGGRK